MVSRTGFAILARLFPLNWGPYYFQRGKRPSRAELFVLLQAIRAKERVMKLLNRGHRLGKRISASELRLRRRYTAFTVEEPLMDDSLVNDRPPLRLLWMVHPKDFGVLHHSVHGALRHVKNPVEEIVFISPSSELTEAHLQSRVKFDVPVRYLDDGAFLRFKDSQKLVEAIGGHAGWASSQLIKVNFILSGDSTPTFMVDSDTVLLVDKQWLYSGGRQLLYSRWYDNPRYERYLRHWGFEEMDPLRSFITHHTLFQPDLLRGLMNDAFGGYELSQLVEAVVSGSRELGFPEFCIDDEPYGQLLFKHYPEKVVSDKYSNVNMMPALTDRDMLRTLESLRESERFNSVSFHNPER